MMKPLVVIALMLASFSISAQSTPPVSVIDFVKIKEGRHPEALYFYENNWKVYRDIALQKGYISSYRILTVQPEPGGLFDLMLITEYSDSTQLALAEERFTAIIKETRPDGPRLLNAVKPADFRHNVYLRRASTLFAPAAPERAGSK